MADQPQEKKIIVDEDWKEEAQREKELLAAALAKEKEQQARPRVPAEASFPVLLSTFATQAMIALGDIPNPFTKKNETNLDEARFHIDMLEMLEQKTKGNLTPDEGRMLEGLLFDLRMRFVEKTSAPAGR